MNQSPDAQAGQPEQGEQPGAVPHRDLRDPAELRALAHPLRLRLLDELVQRDTATATELAERVGESNANCSWHLRVLARHGYIEEAPGGKGRERPWRFVRKSHGFRRFDGEGPELAMEAAAAQDVLYERAVEACRNWREVRHLDANEWRDAAGEYLTWTFLTADELAAFTNELYELVDRHLQHDERIDPANRPPGCRPVRVVAFAVPGSPDTETTEP